MWAVIKCSVKYRKVCTLNQTPFHSCPVLDIPYNHCHTQSFSPPIHTLHSPAGSEWGSTARACYDAAVSVRSWWPRPRCCSSRYSGRRTRPRWAARTALGTTAWAATPAHEDPDSLTERTTGHTGPSASSPHRCHPELCKERNEWCFRPWFWTKAILGTLQTWEKLLKLTETTASSPHLCHPELWKGKA